jgi:hypothetical protein
MNYKKNSGIFPLLAPFRRIIVACDKLKKNIFRVRHFSTCAAVFAVLVSLPVTPVKSQVPAGDSLKVTNANETGLPAKTFSAVIIDMKDNSQDAQKYNVTTSGTIVFLYPDNTEAARGVNLKSPADLIDIMNQVLQK